MTRITLELPKELEFMKNVPSVVLTAALIKMLRDKAEEIKEIDNIVAKSHLTEKDVEELTDKINESAAKHFLE
jgi:cell division protein FtsB